jgi:hypothetical protein
MGRRHVQSAARPYACSVYMVDALDRERIIVEDVATLPGIRDTG